MRTPKVQFFYDFGSPNAYLCHRVLPAIEKRTGVEIDYVPILLGGVFKLTNNVSPMVSLEGIKNKPEFMALETHRFLERHGIQDFARNPHFPVNTLFLMRGAVFAKETDDYSKYVEAAFHHMWREPKKMDDPEVVAAALAESGLPVQEILAGAQDPAIKQRLIDNTQGAVDQGAFGSPSFLVGSELFFGKDQLRRVEEEIVRQS